MDGPRKAFTPEMYEILKTSRCINARLYNHQGQVLINPKKNASDAEMDRLHVFFGQGMFYNAHEEALLFGDAVVRQPISTAKDPQPEALCQTDDGLSNIKLISEVKAQELSKLTTNLFEELRDSPLASGRSETIKAELKGFFLDFDAHPDAMNGLVNVIELMGGMDLLPEPEMAVKRTVVAMAMKTRGMKAQNNRERREFDRIVTDLMVSALLCDMGKRCLKPKQAQSEASPADPQLQSYPLFSYILIAHDENLSPAVKYNILSQHRPLLETMAECNNYPDVLWLREKLRIFAQNYSNEGLRNAVKKDVAEQLANLHKGMHYDEDIAILSIASAFAQLTTSGPGKVALTAAQAVRHIINDAFFTYPDRIVREFLDYISMSLCENQKIIRENDFVILQSYSADKSLVWEVGRILSSNRWQSRPVVRCYATAQPIIKKSPRLEIRGFATESMKLLHRPITVALEGVFQRRIVYIFHEERDASILMSLEHAYASVS